MNNNNICTKYIFKITVSQKYADVFSAIHETLETIGLVLSTNYKFGSITGKWNPLVRNEFGAKINIWTGQFKITDNNTSSMVTLILSGGSDVYSAKFMAKYFIKRLKKSVNVVNFGKPVIRGDNSYLGQLKNTFAKRSMLDQINEAINFADAVMTDGNHNIKEKNANSWSANEDVSYYPDEDHESHEYEEDGYCIECDNFIDDMM